MKINGIALLVGFFFPVSFCHAEKFGTIKNKSIIISKDVDLYGATKKLPKDYTLEVRGGRIKNGTLIGNQTKLICSEKAFDRVNIKGTWNVPEISTSMFTDLSYDNALKDVVSLANPNVQNTIVIEKGDYQVMAQKNADVCLAVPSNSSLIINGTVRLKPNTYQRCDIIRAKGNNIKISGSGSIVGDKHTHLGTDGEWGMGIRFHGAINSSVRDLTIKDCWGDCIYVGGNSKNILIEKCKLDHGRRQGISVTKADGVTIRNTTITNVGGTAPEFAIDIEPNKRDSVDNILIENVTVKGCEGGFLATRGKPKEGAKTPWIGGVTIRNCQVLSKSKKPVSVKRCEEVKIEKCALHAQKGRTAITVTETGKAIVQNNTASIDGSLFEKAKNGAKSLIGKGMDPIYVKTKNQSIVKNNKVVER